jgi:metal-responsive CopG/Arc/MetJ family transcriptional regulator
MTGVRIPAELAERLNAWIERQPNPKPSRAEAIRRLMERGLGEGD